MIQALKLSDIAFGCQGELIGKDKTIDAVSTDTRSIKGNELFVALRGENFDGHQYLQVAIDQGACALVVDSASLVANQLMESLDTNKISVIKVADTLKAFGDIGGLNRAAFIGPVVGITGSAGKTTTKEMIAAILMQFDNTLYTQGNFNNEVGVPKTLLSITKEHHFAVVEMGAAKVGDIAYLSEFVKPDISVLTNAAEAHIQGFGSLDGVAKGKSEIYQALSQKGVGILNIDDDFASYWKDLLKDTGAKVISVALENPQADFYASDIQCNAAGSVFTLNSNGNTQVVSLPVTGIYNVKNALIASATASQLGVSLGDIANALADFSGTSGRMQSTVIGCVTVLDDTYNANPKAMKAALDVLSSRSSCKIAVLGGMGELGEQSDSLHLNVLKHAQNADIDAVFCFGDTWPKYSPFNKATYFDKRESLEAELISYVNSLIDKNINTTVLVKGSRSMKMETFVQLLTSTYSTQTVGAN